MSKSIFLDSLYHFLYDYLPVERGLSYNTQRSYKQTFKLFIQYLYEEHSITADAITFGILDRQKITGFLDWLEKKRNCKPRTRNQRLAAISSFSDYVQRTSVDTTLEFRRAILSVDSKKANNPIRAFFTKEEVKLLLELPKTGRFALRDQTIFVFMYASGARAQEVCDLRVRDISFDESKTYIILHGKGNKSRRIAISEMPGTVLSKYIQQTGKSLSPDSFVFNSQTHDHMSISCVEEIYKKYISKISEENSGLFSGKYSPHSMRHTTATHMVEAGVPLIVIKNFLGHSSIQTTQIYAKISQSQLDEQTRKWNQTWLSVSEPQKKDELIPDFLK